MKDITAALSPSVYAKTQQDITLLLHSNSFSGAIANALAAFCFVYLFNQTINEAKLHNWFILSCVIQAYRAIDYINFKRRISKTPYSKQWKSAHIRFCIGAYLSVLMWAILIIAFFDQMSFAEFAATAILSFLFGAAAITTLAPSLILSLSYVATATLPLTIISFLSNTENYEIFSILGLIFFVNVSSSAIKSSRFTRSAILNRNQKNELLDKQKALLSEMESKNQEVLQVNANLEKTVKERTDSIWLMSNKDSLTDLNNRKAFLLTLETQIKDATASNNPLSLIFIDLDGFKPINDKHGHFVGDEVLKTTAKRLKSIVDDSVCLCRWGGDEFIISFVGHDAKATAEISLLIIETLLLDIVIDEVRVNVGATIGVATLGKEQTNANTLIENADSAMYEQKSIQKGSARIYGDKKEFTR